MGKHTQGPWTIRIASDHKALAIFEESAKEGIYTDAICLVSPLDQIKPHDEANAKLIASAPEMLEVLIKLQPLYDGRNNEFERIINNVIKKATE